MANFNTINDSMMWEKHLSFNGIKESSWEKSFNKLGFLFHSEWRYLALQPRSRKSVSYTDLEEYLSPQIPLLLRQRTYSAVFILIL